MLEIKFQQCISIYINSLYFMYEYVSCNKLIPHLTKNKFVLNLMFS